MIRLLCLGLLLAACNTVDVGPPLADVNAYSMISGAERVAPEALNAEASPRVHDWLRRMEQRPGVKKALSYPGRMRPPPPTEAA